MTLNLNGKCRPRHRTLARHLENINQITTNISVPWATAFLFGVIMFRRDSNAAKFGGDTSSRAISIRVAFSVACVAPQMLLMNLSPSPDDKDIASLCKGHRSNWPNVSQ
ncbi:uncharacterized protein BJ212DRAFT_741966 [Suillus subaureus]|uniref:Uncharacterized protein n=1 Tax=Suillus subaureus TaxID=48587 RepID=A0A9P7AQW2_9AGAM|nr:uncharacterized protein BJ212DRAFT_741966 [Suillus subaureus]KAG1793746.1 hypothetical protein BJ212DRAFT_741966 [Suillus subaureus]